MLELGIGIQFFVKIIPQNSDRFKKFCKPTFFSRIFGMLFVSLFFKSRNFQKEDLFNQFYTLPRLCIVPESHVNFLELWSVPHDNSKQDATMDKKDV